MIWIIRLYGGLIVKYIGRTYIYILRQFSEKVNPPLGVRGGGNKELYERTFLFLMTHVRIPPNNPII